MKLFSRLNWLLLLVLLIPRIAWPQTAPRVAVWNPEAGTAETRFSLDLNQLDQTAQDLKAAGIGVERLTSAQINSPDFNARRFDALFLPGDTFPFSNVAALRDFTGDGGVLVALGATVPFLIAIETKPDGTWTMAPATPPFAWQKTDILQLFGLKYSYKPELHDSGVTHEPSPLLRKYLPGATAIHSKRPSRWIYPTGDAAMFALLGSKRSNGDAVTPQIYVAKKGARQAIIVGENFTTDGVPGWPEPTQVVVALARLAADLKNGKAQLDPATKVVGLENLKVPGTLERYEATSTLDPPNTKPLVQWGHFNGSSLDLPASETQTLPRSLAPGASVELALDKAKIPANEPVFLRVRGGFDASGAGLKLELHHQNGARLLWNEIFTSIDARSAGNFNPSLAGLPTEWTRLIFVPAEGAPQTLTVSNPGTQPVYFDALQLETRTAPPPQRIVGLGAGTSSIARETSRSWTNIRVNPRPQLVGPPDDPDRWKAMDKKMAEASAANAHIQIVWEGTPTWAAISPARLELGVQAKRPHTVPPDPQKDAALLAEFIARYGDKVDSYEIWNEPDIQQFWRGSNAEYVALYDTLTPVIRRLDPTAQIITAGMAGFKDAWVGDLVEAKVPQRADLFAFHPYAGKSAGWDTAYGLVQGALLARGQNIEIYCDESGFVSRNSEWFQPPPNFTPEVQARLLDTAMARLLATDLAKLNIFNAGGDGNPFGLFDGRGQPLPAYAVFADYLPLGQNGARRLDVSLTGANGEPLQGVYSAAATHSDGSATIVVNPVESEALQPPPNPSTEWDNASGWTVFFGKAQKQDDLIVVTPDAGQEKAGFYRSVTVDPARLPLLEINIPRSEGGYDLIFKLAGGQQIPVVTNGAAGVWRGDLRQILPAGTREFEMSFRVHGPTAFDYAHFSSDETAVPLTPLPVRLLVPLLSSGNYAAQARSNGQEVAVESRFTKKDGQQWAEITLPLRARAVVELKPEK